MYNFDNWHIGWWENEVRTRDMQVKINSSHSPMLPRDFFFSNVKMKSYDDNVMCISSKYDHVKEIKKKSHEFHPSKREKVDGEK